MADELFALSTLPAESPAEMDYDALCGAIMGTARGRWFLQEYSRRNRHADTDRLIAAIARIETVMRGDRAALADQTTRASLLELARAIATTRADVAEIKPATDSTGAPVFAAPEPAQPGILAAAERLQDVAWAMRERDLDPATCDQIEAIAKAVRSASALRDPNDRRARRLGEALTDLERRVDAMLAAYASRSAPVRETGAADGTPELHQDESDHLVQVPAGIAEAEPALPAPIEAQAGVDAEANVDSPGDPAEPGSQNHVPATELLDIAPSGGIHEAVALQDAEPRPPTFPVSEPRSPAPVEPATFESQPSLQQHIGVAPPSIETSPEPVHESHAAAAESGLDSAIGERAPNQDEVIGVVEIDRSSAAESPLALAAVTSLDATPTEGDFAGFEPSANQLGAATPDIALTRPDMALTKMVEAVVSQVELAEFRPGAIEPGLAPSSPVTDVLDALTPAAAATIEQPESSKVEPSPTGVPPETASRPLPDSETSAVGTIESSTDPAAIELETAAATIAEWVYAPLGESADPPQQTAAAPQVYTVPELSPDEAVYIDWMYEAAEPLHEPGQIAIVESRTEVPQAEPPQPGTQMASPDMAGTEVHGVAAASNALESRHGSIVVDVAPTRLDIADIEDADAGRTPAAEAQGEPAMASAPTVSSDDLGRPGTEERQSDPLALDLDLLARFESETRIDAASTDIEPVLTAAQPMAVMAVAAQVPTALHAAAEPHLQLGSSPAAIERRADDENPAQRPAAIVSESPPQPSSAPAEAVEPETLRDQTDTAGAPAMPPQPVTPPVRARPMPPPADVDPLAALKSLTDEERLALFT